jgi:hypothetical protein
MVCGFEIRSDRQHQVVGIKQIVVDGGQVVGRLVLEIQYGDPALDRESQHQHPDGGEGS